MSSRSHAACIVVAGIVMALATAARSDELQKPDAGKKIRVFLFAGQSNMEGRADGHSLAQTDQDRLKAAGNRVQLAFNHRPFQPLDVVKPPEGIGDSYHLDRIFGPELFCGIALAEAWSDERMLFIKRTNGGTSLYGCWNPNWSEDKAALMNELEKPKLYGDFIDYVKRVLSGYRSDEYEVCAMCWVQGETDSGNEVAAAAYGDNLRRLITRVRDDLDLPALPFILLQVGRGKVVEGMQATSRDLPNVILIPQSLDPASPDFYQKIPNGHYNHEGLKTIGSRFAEAFLKIRAK